MKPSAKFWDRIANRYSKQPVADEASYQTKLEVTREYLRPSMTVLEIGCGTGSTAITHAPHVKHIHAVDISSKMIGIAQGKADAASVDNITFAQATIEDLDIEDASVDAVLALSILHLLADLDAAIAKVHAMLKPGGILVASTPCLGDTMKFFKIIGPIGHFLGLIPYVNVLTAQALETSVLDGGFAIDHRWRPGKGKAVFLVAKKS